ncbi:MAG: sulfatase-like hydrolase/transferase [Flavobacteriaceae bacterium]|nr:sulfatase-like hydrolase/transferase [Flavobacteriaceae bacterium]MDG2314264.1 sulfatase-like hydrolase/transferase [Flavobacteriaceae bacterium]
MIKKTLFNEFLVDVLFGRFCLLILLFKLSFATVYAQKELVKQPNIIFILTDDHRYDLLGCTGNKFIQTPHLDKLATDGILFTNAHVTSAICTPSRASIFLSQFERKHGVNFNSGTSVAESAWNDSYPVVLRKNGYYTGYIGKNHVPIGVGGYKSGVMEASFDYWYAGHGHLSFYPKNRHKIFKGAVNDTQVEVLEEGATDFLSNEYKLAGAKHFLSGLPEDKPFCMSINFNLPHGASTSTMKMLSTDLDTYKSLYRDKEIPLPKYYTEKNAIISPKLPANLLHANDRQDIYDFVDNKQDLRERMIRNMQAVTGIDALVGNLRQTLKDRNLDKNTIIIFTSDHGIFWGENGLGGKALCYEVCTRVPMIVYDPTASKNNRGIKSNELVQTIDLAPTMLSYASIPLPASYQGKPLNTIIHGNDAPVRDVLFTENLWSTHFGNPRCEAVQNKEWKYIRYYKNSNLSAQYLIETAKKYKVNMKSMLYANHDPQIALYQSYIEGPLNKEPAVYEELYHLKNDPDEQNNLAKSRANTEKLEEMRQVWNNTLREARGNEALNVVRYTMDSEAERASSIKPE